MVFLPLTTRRRGSSGECGFASQVTVWHSTASRSGSARRRQDRSEVARRHCPRQLALPPPSCTQSTSDIYAGHLAGHLS